MLFAHIFLQLKKNPNLILLNASFLSMQKKMFVFMCWKLAKDHFFPNVLKHACIKCRHVYYYNFRSVRLCIKSNFIITICSHFGASKIPVGPVQYLEVHLPKSIDKTDSFRKLEAWLLYLTTAVGSLFLAGLMPAGGAVWSLTPRSPTLYRACG